MSQIGVGTISEQALVAATAQTLVQLIAAANHGITILGWGVFFDGISPTAEPVQIELARQTTAGTASSLTLVKYNDSNGDSLDTTAQQDVTAEPTKGDVLDVAECHPQASIQKYYPYGKEPKVGAGDRIGLICTAPAAVNARVWILFEE